MTNPIKNYRQNFINLNEIFGVDLENAALNPHPDFINCKETIREEVIECLSSAANPSIIPPIEVFLDDEGAIHIVDGYHRLVNALRKYKTDPELWGKIKYERFNGTKEEAHFRAVAQALEDGRSCLTDSEEFKAIAKWIHAGYTVEEIVTKLGRNNIRWVNKVTDIIGKGIPALEQAVREGTIDVTTATQIARKTDVKDQKQVLDEAIKESQTGKNISDVRRSLGIGRNRKTRNFDDCKQFIISIWDADASRVWEANEFEENLDGQITAIIWFLNMDTMTKADISEIFDEWFWDTQDKEKEKIDKQSSKKKAPWQVKK